MNLWTLLLMLAPLLMKAEPIFLGILTAYQNGGMAAVVVYLETLLQGAGVQLSPTEQSWLKSIIDHLKADMAATAAATAPAVPPATP